MLNDEQGRYAKAEPLYLFGAGERIQNQVVFLRSQADDKARQIRRKARPAGRCAAKASSVDL